MGLADIFNSGADEKVRYLQIRERFGVLMSECFGSLMADEVRAISRRLDLHPLDPIMGDQHATEIAIYDAAVFHVLRGGESAVARMQRNLPADAPDLDRAIVAGWQQHRWSIFAATSVRRGMDIGLRDTLDGWETTVRDLDLAASIRVGHRLVIRIVPVQDLWLTTGPGFGLDEDIQVLIRQHLPTEWQNIQTWPARGTPERDAITLRLITAFHAGPKPEPSAVEPPRKGPCPCGSGKKYKHCCGKGR